MGEGVTREEYPYVPILNLYLICMRVNLAKLITVLLS